MTFTELELVLLFANAVLTILFFMARRESAAAKNHAAMFIHGVALGKIKASIAADGSLQLDVAKD